MVIKWVYDNNAYEKSMQFAELIVRVPHILAHYHNDPFKIEETSSIFQSLFDFFINRSLPEMEKKIPELEEEFERKKQEKVLKQKMKISLLRKIILTLSIMSPILIILTAFLIFSPIYTWDALSYLDKMKFMNATIDFHGVNVKFKDLFSNDSNVYGLLSSEQIKFGLNNESKNLSEAIKNTYDHFVFLTWENMTEDLKNKFVTLNVNFQGKNVKLNEIFNANLKNPPLKFLNSINIREIFKGIPMNISSSVKIETKCFIDRKFKEENSKNYKEVKILRTSDIFSELNENKIFILSNQAGEGKSTVLRHFVLKFKEENQSKWIQFVDLKKYFNLQEKRKILNIFNRAENDNKKFVDFLIQIFKFE
jgi:hypothetical protein